ncbi:SAM-dependent methyltransferase [Virgibacillus phasianinus]|uniref:SAM-dependent methyltransferase n=1 Tax=Virgibacillus phasianinus TaxID=2017483 RepID=A0A220U1I5_9BACI|nr:methyltransferase domain-containing protein [Virgibacillus phasianinus]ASK61905.1 SAM-dependent methyltransferase [Virgibacillus phasianinus]
MSDKRFDPKKADKLFAEERRKLIPPEKVTEYLQVGQGDTVADLGAGNGYFTLPIAQRTSKTVYAVDVEPKMLELLKANAKNEQLTNIKYVVSDLENIGLEDNTVNRVFVAFVIHEVPDIDKVLGEMKRILKPGGQMVLVEWEAIETESGPPLHHRIPSEKMVDIINRNGLQAEITHLNPANYLVKITA